jgi:hypothetical protein
MQPARLFCIRIGGLSKPFGRNGLAANLRDFPSHPPEESGCGVNEAREKHAEWLCKKPKSGQGSHISAGFEKTFFVLAARQHKSLAINRSNKFFLH